MKNNKGFIVISALVMKFLVAGAIAVTIGAGFLPTEQAPEPVQIEQQVGESK